MFIELGLNDHTEPLFFMFDTGAGITVMDTEVSKKVNLKITEEANIGTAGKTIRSGISLSNHIHLGHQLTLDSVEIAILDLSNLSMYFKTKIDGIIGTDILFNFVTETNNDAGELRLYPFNTWKPGKSATANDIIGLEAGHFGIPVEVVTKRNAKTVSMVVKIDTGADNALTFHNAAVTQYQLPESVAKRIKSKQGFGVDSTLTNNLSSKLYSATFNGKQWRRVPVVFEVDPTNRISERQADGLIGQALLLDFNTIYDLQQGLVYFENR
jgi:predicted aspartyl protease